MSSVVRLRAAVALAGRFPALSGVDLTVAPGEVVAVLGPNGSGKTSLLRACAGLLPVTAGEAEVLGCDLREDRTAVRRRVGLLGHDAPLYDELTALENVRFAVRAAGLAAGQVEPALDRLGLTGRLRRTPVGRLSAGQRRRAALAVLVARDPELWLLDEPHAALDAAARTLLSELVAESTATGAAVLLSSHEPDLAVPMADRVVVLSGGAVAEERPGGRRPRLSAVGPLPDADAAEERAGVA
jgi:heme ABC exporter ATP-binding subunit CcmA